MNNLKKFSTEADYSAATLNYPAVSWVTATDNVHFDKTEPTPPVVNDKVMMAWTTESGEYGTGKDIVLWNGSSSHQPSDLFNSLTINNVDILSTIDASGTLNNYSTPDTDYLVKYELKEDTTITDMFAGTLGGGWGSYPVFVDFLVPSQVTEIWHLPDNIQNLVIEATTVPTTSLEWSSVGSVTLYVPTESVTAYQTAYHELLDVGGSILPISQYSGNLPV